MLDAGERARRLLARRVSEGVAARVSVSGECMGPLIVGGDRVEAARGGPLVAGDVVLARGRDGGLVCHRVLGHAGGRPLLAGDRSLMPEEVDEGLVLGVVRVVETEAGTMRLGRGWAWRLDRLQAFLHLLEVGYRGSAAGRGLHLVRRVLGELRALWRPGRMASLLRRGGTSSLRRPASSR